ncbi:MAG: hypothetical protein ACE15C_13215 [Phycisphaerae bacterium]
MNSIASVAPTICRVMGVAPPKVCRAEPLDAVLAAWAATGDGSHAPRTVEKCLIYAPDAIGAQMVERWPASFRPVPEIAPIAVDLRAVMPPKTPVCFASMFTGAMPEVHGIRKYEKPVLACDTLFDALIRAGKRPAIVSTVGCSMDRIFRERPMDYFSQADDEAVMSRTLNILESSAYDLIVCYQIGYDKCVHSEGPYCPAAIGQMEEKIANFKRVAAAVRERWAGRRVMIGFCPDHGAHVDEATGKGDHCLDIPQDMNVRHFFGFRW